MNVIENYTEYLNKSYTYIMKTILGKNYNSTLVKDYVDSYINARYYNDEDINSFYKKQEKKHQEIKDIEAINTIFDYILYLDDCGEIKSLQNIFKLNIADNGLYFNEDKKAENLYHYINDFLAKKEEYLNLFETKDFELKPEKIKNKLYNINISHNIQLPSLYSTHAKRKAFNTGLVNEDKMFIAYYLLSIKLLKDTIARNKKNHYIVELPKSILAKHKKILRLLEIINNPVAKEYISLKVKYIDYLKNKKQIDSYIKEGYKFTIILDDLFIQDEAHLSSLIIFDKVIIEEQFNNYNYIKENIDKIKPEVISR